MDEVPHVGEEDVLNRIRDCVANVDSDGADRLVREALHDGVSPADIITKAISRGTEIVGKKFEVGQYFLTELVLAGEIVEKTLAILTPHLGQANIKPKGKIVIGTVEGDIHDIGKNIVVMFLKSPGFDVVDLGVDVPKEDFVNAINKHKADIVAMSTLMTLTAPAMGEVVRRVKEVGLREAVKIIIGGAPITREFGALIGVDYQTNDPIKGVERCLGWVKAKTGVIQ